jgi:hypothetical protein
VPTMLKITVTILWLIVRKCRNNNSHAILNSLLNILIEFLLTPAFLFTISKIIKFVVIIVYFVLKVSYNNVHIRN